MKRKKPKRCDKCGSKKIKASWCPGSRKGAHLVTGIGDSHGFVCRTYREHFHYFCKECGYAEY